MKVRTDRSPGYIFEDELGGSWPSDCRPGLETLLVGTGGCQKRSLGSAGLAQAT